MKYDVFYVKKDELPKGAYGLTVYSLKSIFIREDLPSCVKKSILSHERQHEKDYRRGFNLFYNELRGNIAGMRHPIGFITCVIMTIFSINRWKFYIRYFKK